MARYRIPHTDPNTPICDLRAEVLHARGGRMDEFFDRCTPDEILGDAGRVAWESFSGRLLWAGHLDKIRRVDATRVSALVGNSFEMPKARAVYDAIRTPPPGGRILLVAPLAYITFVDARDVRESLESDARETLWQDMHLTRPFTTGTPDLDEYLLRPKEVLDELTYADEPNSRAEARADYEARLTTACLTKTGDLGKPWVHLRDGNHRIFGAIAAGESWVCAYFDGKNGDPSSLPLPPRHAENLRTNRRRR